MLGLLFVVVFVPVGVVSLRLVRNDPMERPAAPGHVMAAPGRLDRAPDAPPHLRQRSDLRAQGSPSTGRLLRLVGAVTVILLVDLAVGTFLLDTPTTGSTPGGDPAEIPALAGVPHVRPMMTEFFGARVGMYDPFLGWRLADYDGDHLNIAGGERASYESSVPGEPIVVWFFGASTMYRYGQRDDHHPVELVRMAEADGINVEAHNFGTAGIRQLAGGGAVHPPPRSA